MIDKALWMLIIGYIEAPAGIEATVHNNSTTVHNNCTTQTIKLKCKQTTTML